FFRAEDGIRDFHVTGVQTCALPIYEVQVLQSRDNPTYADGMAGAIYGQNPPLVNPCRAMGQWNTFDIIFRRPRFNDDGSLAAPRSEERRVGKDCGDR